MSFRDIGAILKKASAEENENGQTTDKMEQHPALSVSAQSYKLFSEGKTPIDVAVSLNLTQPEVTHFYREYWDLMKLQCLNKIYDDLGEDIGAFLKLYALCNSAGYDKKQVVELLKMADDNLQGFEYRYKLLKEEADSLENKKFLLQKSIKNLEEENGVLKKIQNSYRLMSNRESEKLSFIQKSREKLEALVSRFEYDNEEYIKIRRYIEDQVDGILADKKSLLQLALSSLTESIRHEPSKYGILMLLSNPSQTIGLPHSKRHHSSIIGRYDMFHEHPEEAYRLMVLDEAERLFDKMVKDLVHKVVERSIS